jgi:isopentenyl-diphosphate Delta-isomerase
MVDQLILVNENNEAIGVGEKLQIHQDGLLHRAFSVFILNADKELLLQRRALEKYHSAGLWSNTCCGHPRPGEQLISAARRRLKTEMGLNCRLREIGSLIYRAKVGNGLVEHEFDHLLIGQSEVDPILNPAEAIAWQWIGLKALEADLQDRPQVYTCWLKIIISSALLKSLICK